MTEGRTDVVVVVIITAVIHGDLFENVILYDNVKSKIWCRDVES